MENPPKIVVMLRVKDGILFINSWLASVDKYADEIVVVDNGSTDGTLEIIKEHPKLVRLKQTVGFDEGRDLTILLEMAKSRNPDWLMQLDVDEIFEDIFDRTQLNKLIRFSFINTVAFRLFPMIQDESHYMGRWQDLLYVLQPRRYLYRMNPNLNVEKKKIHVGVNGISKMMYISSFRIKHICDLFVEYKERRYDQYIEIDPSRERMYLEHKSLLRNHDRVFVFRERSQSVVLFFEYVLLNFLYIVYYPIKKIFRFEFH